MNEATNTAAPLQISFTDQHGDTRTATLDPAAGSLKFGLPMKISLARLEALFSQAYPREFAGALHELILSNMALQSLLATTDRRPDDDVLPPAQSLTLIRGLLEFFTNAEIK